MSLKQAKTVINRSQGFSLADKRVIKSSYDAIYTDINDAASQADLDALQADVDSLADTPNDIYGGGLQYGSVTWISGLTFEVSDCGYIIDGVEYTSSQTEITLAAADAANPRIDVIYVDADGLVGKITGTAAADPAKPEIDPLTQLELTFITVAALATTPENVSVLDLYLENAGDPAEWDATESTSAARIALGSTADPYSGTKAIAFTAAENDDYVTLTAGTGAEVSTNSFTSLESHIKLTTWDSRSQVRVAFFNGAERVSAWVQIKDGNYGFDASDTSDYQVVNIPVADFRFSGGQADSMQFLVFTRSGSVSTFSLDQVRMQLGNGTVIIKNTTADPSADIKLVTGTTYTITQDDNGKTLVFTNAAAVAVTWPDGLPLNFHVSLVQTTAAGIPTVTPSGTDTINGAGTGVEPTAQWNAMYLAKYDTGKVLAIL